MTVADGFYFMIGVFLALMALPAIVLVGLCIVGAVVDVCGRIAKWAKQ